MTAIAWIRREMREYDNQAIVEASKEHEEVIPFYVVDTGYFEAADLGYPRVKFWRESLEELNQHFDGEDGKDLVVRHGEPVQELQNIIEETGADEVFHAQDYTPYARSRDTRVAEELEVPVKRVKDLVLFEKREILTNSGDPYSVYSYYRDKWFDRDKPRPEKPEHYTTPELESDEIPSLDSLGFEKPEHIDYVWKGGRSRGRERLDDFMEKIGEYDEKRDLAAEPATSRLSPHFKFGTVSIREAFWEAERAKARGQDSSGVETWQEELAWRDFYFQMLWKHPKTVDEPFLEKYGSLEWDSRQDHPEKWKRWKEGRTGFPFVDAGMRQLRSIGWMHNRLRMVVTSFACKDLWLEWREVHEYFSKMFVDADVSVMIGGIQWAYSIGTDAQPYFRVFNPVSQGERFDSEGEYIREWVPELSDVPDEHIHKPWEMSREEQEEHGCVIGEDYPERIVDHSERREKAIEAFENAAENDEG